MRIESIYYYDYTNKLGFYDSIRDFGQEEMRYIGTVISTPEFRVNAIPCDYKINAEISKEIRELVINLLPSLKEISKDLAVNSPKYLEFHYFDGSKKYFEYTKLIDVIFDTANKCKPEEANVTIEVPNEMQIQPTSSSYIAPSPNPAPAPKKKFSLGKLLVLFLVIYIGLLISSGVFEEKDPGLKPLDEPISGKILTGSEVIDGSEITVTAAGNSSCVVKLKTTSGITRLSFYVRAGESATVGVPAEYLNVYFATGDIWYGPAYLFGEDTYYSKDDSTLDINGYTWEYTLTPVTNGNFNETPISADEF